MSGTIETDERTPLLSTETPTARLFSGELDLEEHENLSNQLQEDSEWRASDVDTLLPPTATTTNARRERTGWRRHKRLILFVLALLLVIAANVLVVYFVYFHNSVRLKGK